MTQEEINKVFQTELGQQCIELFTTSDDSIFIRYEEAVEYTNDKSLEDKTITSWYEETEL